MNDLTKRFIEDFGGGTRQCPLAVDLKDNRYSLRVDSDTEHLLRQGPHWHLYLLGEPVARITAYGCWTSLPNPDEVPPGIRTEAEELTSRYLFKIIRACNQHPQAEQEIVEKLAGENFFSYKGNHQPLRTATP